MFLQLVFKFFKVVLTDWEYPSYHRKQANALYREFSIGDESSSYRLNVNNFTFIEEPRWECAGDSLEYSDGMQVVKTCLFSKCFLLGWCSCHNVKIIDQCFHTQIFVSNFSYNVWIKAYCKKNCKNISNNIEFYILN